MKICVYICNHQNGINPAQKALIEYGKTLGDVLVHVIPDFVERNNYFFTGKHYTPPPLSKQMRKDLAVLDTEYRAEKQIIVHNAMRKRVMAQTKPIYDHALKGIIDGDLSKFIWGQVIYRFLQQEKDAFDYVLRDSELYHVYIGHIDQIRMVPSIFRDTPKDANGVNISWGSEGISTLPIKQLKTNFLPLVNPGDNRALIDRINVTSPTWKLVKLLCCQDSWVRGKFIHIVIENKSLGRLITDSEYIRL